MLLARRILLLVLLAPCDSKHVSKDYSITDSSDIIEKDLITETSQIESSTYPIQQLEDNDDEDYDDDYHNKKNADEILDSSSITEVPSIETNELSNSSNTFAIRKKVSSESNDYKDEDSDFTFKDIPDNSTVDKQTTDGNTEIYNKTWNSYVTSEPPYRNIRLLNPDLTGNFNYTPTFYNDETTTQANNYTVAIPARFTDEEMETTAKEFMEEEGALITHHYNEESLPLCPKNLKHKSIGESSFCYTITEPTEFPPACPYPNNILQHSHLHGFDYNNLIKITNKSVWAFAKRNTSNGFGKFEYFNITNEEVFPYVPAKEDILNKNCLIISNSNLVAVNCKDKYPAVCVYDFIYLTFDEYCSRRYNASCFSGDLNSPNICYCKIVSHEALPRNNFCEKLAEPKQPYQNNLLIRYLTNKDGCWIGVQNNANQYEWSSTNTTTNYTYWSPENYFTKLYGAITYRGWALTNDRSLNCAICEIAVEDHPQTSLHLKYNKTRSKVELHIMNAMELYGDVICFTDNSRIHVPLLTKNLGHQTMDITTLNNAASYYWCKGIQISGLTPVHSNKIFVDKLEYSTGHQYSIKILYPARSDPYVDFLDKAACEIIRSQNEELFQNVRTIKVIQFDEENGYIEVLCRLITTPAGLSIQEEIEHLSNLFKTISYTTKDLASTETCLPSTTISGGTILHWSETPMGTTTTSDEICLQENGLPVTRTCMGDRLIGGFWAEVNGICGNVTISPRTLSLHELVSSKSFIPTNLSKSLLNITQDTFNVTSFQIHLISRVLTRLAHIARSNIIENFIGIVNNLMHFDHERLRQAQNLLNATDNLLYNLDESLIRTKMNDRYYEIAVVTEKLLIQEISLQNNEVKGIKLTKSKEGAGFNKNDLKFINQDVNQSFSNESDLEAAIIISEELKTELQSCPGSASYPNIIATIFYDDSLFNTNKNITAEHSDGKIVSLLAPGFNCEFTTPLKVVFKSSAPNGTQYKCAFWAYGVSETLESIQGRWSIENDPQGIDNSSYKMCKFTHMTHFALLVLGETEDTIGEVHKKVLDIITAVGSGLSLLGLFVIFLTAIIFKSFRSANGIVINFSIATTAQIVILFLADNLTEDEMFCTVLGVFLHYIVLVQFLWMFAVAFLQYKRYVLIFSNPTTHLVMKWSAFCWGTPLIPVIVIVSISSDNYGKNSYGLCYALGNYFIFGLLLPVCIIILLNLFIFLRIMMSIVSSRKLRAHRKEDNTSMLQFRLSVMLYFLLGLTWGFGLLAASGAGIVYSYLFCLTATLQGFILFLYFIVINENTRKLWINLMPCMKSDDYDINSDSASSTMMQRRGRYTNTSDASSNAAHTQMLQKYKNRNSSDF